MSEKKESSNHQKQQAADSPAEPPAGPANATSVNDDVDDDVDEDLMALSPPPPSPWYLVFVVAILVLSVTMLVWFFPDLRFLAAQFGGPTDLGEAADIDMSTVRSNQYVHVEGFPMVQRTLTFKEGIKWFTMSDNTRKFFPLTGQPHLFVQWTEPMSHKAYRTPETNPGVIGPPSEFTGHLVSREDLGANYAPVFVFYDCLDHHYLGRCNRCLGKATQAACRDAFVCVENNSAEACTDLLARSEGDIRRELEATRAAGQDGAATQQLEAMLRAKREHRLEVASVRLEELSQQADRLAPLAEGAEDARKERIEAVQKELLDLRLKELESRAADMMRTVAALSEKKRAETHAAIEELDAKRAAVERLAETLKVMRAVIEIGDALERLKGRSKAIADEAALIPLDARRALAALAPRTADGEAILTAITALEAAVAEKKLALVKPDRGAATDAGVAAPEAPPSPPDPASDADLAPLVEKLEALNARTDALLTKLRYFKLGAAPELEAWAMAPDVLGQVPEGLRDTRVIGALDKIEEMLEGAPAPHPSEDAPLLAEAYNDAIDALDQARQQVATLERKPALVELRLMADLERLQRDAAAPERSAGVLREQLNQLITDLTGAGLYLNRLQGDPEAMARLERLFEGAALDEYSATLSEAAEALTPGDYVLIDGKIPLDKLWVVAIYLILIAMIIVNLRKIWRFYLAYRA